MWGDARQSVFAGWTGNFQRVVEWFENCHHTHRCSIIVCSLRMGLQHEDRFGQAVVRKYAGDIFQFVRVNSGILFLNHRGIRKGRDSDVCDPEHEKWKGVWLDQMPCL